MFKIRDLKKLAVSLFLVISVYIYNLSILNWRMMCMIDIECFGIKKGYYKIGIEDPDNKNDEEGCWRPLYDGVRQSHGHGYNMIDAWVYWFIFALTLGIIVIIIKPNNINFRIFF